MNKKKTNKKGFTLIELLGVIVIIGIISTISIVAVSRYFNKSRDQIDTQNKNNVKIAAESYFQANRDLLPKGIGEFATVDLKDLRKANYLTSDVSNSKDESCMAESYVRVVKLDDEHYSYLVNLYCGDETRPDIYEKPIIPYLVKFEFQGNVGHGSAFSDVKNAKFSFTIRGSENDRNIGIYSYQYMISVKEINGGDDSGDYHTVFDSGSIKANSQYEVSVDSEKLSKYIDITGQVRVKVDIAVMNDQGGYLNYSSDGDSTVNANEYEDIQPPICGQISGVAASDDEWTNKATYSSGTTNLGKTRGFPSVITVACEDGEGSGCKRPDFSKSWPTVSKNEIGSVDYQYGARWAYVVLEDNAVNTSKKSKDCSDSKFIVDSTTNEVKSCTGGNKTVCYVRVNVDIYSPTVNVKVYKSGTNEVVKELTVKDKKEANVTNPEGTIKSADYKGAVGVDKEEWLNLANFPDGIELGFNAEDQLYLYHWTWETNDAYLPYATVDSDVTKNVSENNANLDGTITSHGYFSKTGLIEGEVTNPEQLIANETGPLKSDKEVRGLKLKLEGKRYGKLTVYDRAGNSTTIHVYANIDRTPPEIPDMTHKKNGAETEKTNYTESGATKEKLIYKASGDEYVPATKDDYTDNNHWSRETLNTYIEGQRIDNKATVNKVYDTNIRGNGDLSGWWKFTYVYEMQDPTKPRYSWKKAEEKDAVETLEFKDEGTHKVRIRSCDKAKNCSEFSPDDYLKIDYTLPLCDIKETFSGVQGCKGDAITCFNESCKSDGKTCYNKNGWLKIGESVVLSHACSDPNSNISSDCNANSKFNQQKYEYNFDVDTGKAGANGFVNSKSGKSVNNTYINSEDFRDEWYNPGTMTAGGHVVDYAGNIQECPVKEVKIDYIIPKCTTKIEYGKDGSIDSNIHPKNPSDESGWLSLYKGGIDGTPGKETATVSTVCEDFKSDGPRMTGVISDCDKETYKSTVYNWELRTTIAGALGVGQGGEIADLAGNIAQCPADRSVNIDYTQPKCNTIIEYPQGSPINQTDTDIESGWLGYNDNVNCLNGKIDYSYRNGGTASAVTGSANKTGLESGTPASSSNIKGEGNVKTVTHNAYLTGYNANSTVTRGEYAKILCNALGVQPLSSYTAMFKDVTESTPNWGYILAASQQGFFLGVGDGNFSPNSNLKRAELAATIMRAAASRGVTSSKSCAGVRFTDYPDDAWYASDLRAASNNCYFVGTGSSGNEVYASPTKDATIAQVATVIYRAFREEDEVGCKTSDKKSFDAKSMSLSPAWASAALADATTSHTCTNGVEASGIVQSDGSMQFDAYVDNTNINYNETISRQEFLKMAYNAAQVPGATSYKSVFSDVPKSNSYWPYIIAASDAGYVYGTGGGRFSPEGQITRADAITIIVRLMEKKNMLPTGKTCSANIPDLESGKYYSNDMKKAAENCLLVGDTSGMFRPTSPTTNMEAIAILYRAFRDHEGLDCTTADGSDYDSTMASISKPGGGTVASDFWGYEYLKDATTPHTCSGTLIDPATKNNTKTNIPDTSCDQRVDEKKTTIITQICTEKGEFNSATGQNGITSGCYGSMKNATASVETNYQTKTYDFEVNTTRGGAVDVDNNGYIVDVAGNITNCGTPENWHTVKIDYTRPTCDISATYNDRRKGESGDYKANVHFMGKNSSVVIRSFCSTDGGGSNCWEEKNSSFTYSSEIKTDNGTSKPNLEKAYTYDLAGNRSDACPVNPVQIDHTGPVCKTHARYKKATSIPATNDPNADPKDVYDPNKVMVTNWASGWLSGDYTVRVISYCEKDEIKNVVQASDNSGAGCKGATASPKVPDGEKNQRSYNDYHAANGTVINAPKGAKGKQNKTTNNEEFYEHKAFSIGGGVTRREFAQTLLDAVGIDVDSSATSPFTDAGSDSVIGTVYQYGLMIGTSSTEFSPNTKLTRAQMIVATVRAAQSLGISHDTSCTKSTFSDYTRGSNVWYASYVDYAIDNCILVGFGNGTLRPEDITTPDQVYAVMDRALRPHEEGYKCTPDVISQRGDSPWTKNGSVEKQYHKCVKEENANADGAKHVIYDDVGNKTECDDIQIKLDAEKPKCTVSQSPIDYDSSSVKWTKSSSITVTKKCDDGSSNGSGCHDAVDSVTKNDKCNTQTDKRTYTLSSSNATTYSSREKSWAGHACQNKESSGYVYDNVGNQSAACVSSRVGIDQEPPTCEIYNDGVVGSWTKSNVSIRTRCTDKGSQCTSSSTPTLATFYPDYNQTHTYNHTTYDNVGNSKQCTPKTYTIKIDANPPSFSCSWNPYYYNDSSSNSPEPYFNSYPTDNYSGVDSSSIYKSYPYTLSCSNSGYKTASIRVCDNNNNCQTVNCGSISIPSCCSSTYTDYGSSYWTGCSSCKGYEYLMEPWYKISNYNDYVNCGSGERRIDSSYCGPCPSA